MKTINPRLVRCIKDYKVFKSGHVYPVCGNNNGSHVIGMDKDGEPFDLICHDYGDIGDKVHFLCDHESDEYNPIFEEFSPSLNTLRDEIYEDAVAHGLWEDCDEEQRRNVEFCAKYAQFAFDTDVECRLQCALRVCAECVELREARDDADAFAEELADVIIMSMSVAGKLGIDIDAAVRNKMAINKERPWKHRKEENV